MKAAVARLPGQPLTIEQVPVPAVIPGRILVKVAACGVCHLDLRAITGKYRLMVFQFSGFDAIHGDFSCFADAPPPAVGKFGYQSVQNHTDTNQLPD